MDTNSDKKITVIFSALKYFIQQLSASSLISRFICQLRFHLTQTHTFVELRCVPFLSVNDLVMMTRLSTVLSFFLVQSYFALVCSN